MKIKYFFLFFFPSVLGVQCGKEQALNEKTAGSYSGTFACVSYTGHSYPRTETNGVLELVAAGADSLRLKQNYYCLYATSFVHDAALSTNTTDYWKGPGSQDLIISRNDSVFVYLPRLSGYGWLAQEFKGKRQ